MPSSYTAQILRSHLDSQNDDHVGETALQDGGVEQVSMAIRRASLRVPRANCLVQAISGWLMLRRRGIRAVVRIGVDKNVSDFSAHAWLCVGERVIIGGEDAPLRFVTLERRRATDRFG
jgi:hypothetical protein